MMNEANLCMGMALYHLEKEEEGLTLMKQVDLDPNSFSITSIQTKAHTELLHIAVKNHEWDKVTVLLDSIENHAKVIEWWNRMFGQNLLDCSRIFKENGKFEEAQTCENIFAKWWDNKMVFTQKE
jgi:hypothetical protein